jgi:hypothetical protein
MKELGEMRVSKEEGEYESSGLTPQLKGIY